VGNLYLRLYSILSLASLGGSPLAGNSETLALQSPGPCLPITESEQHPNDRVRDVSKACDEYERPHTLESSLRDLFLKRLVISSERWIGILGMHRLWMGCLPERW